MTGAASFTATGPATISALLDRLQATDALADTLVRWGLLATLPTQRERVYLTGIADYQRAAVTAAHRVRQDNYSVRGIIEVHDPSTDGPEEASGRAWDLLDTVDQVLRDDPDLLVARYDHSVRVLIDEVMPATDGWIARLAFRLGFFHTH